MMHGTINIKSQNVYSYDVHAEGSICHDTEKNNSIQVNQSHISTVNNLNRVQGGSYMTGTDSACLHTNQSWSYLNHLVFTVLHIRESRTTQQVI